MRLLHYGKPPPTTDLAWFFRVAAGNAGVPVLVLSGSMLVSHTPDPPVRKETPRSAANRMAPRKVAGDLLVSGRAWPDPRHGNRRAVRVAVEMGKWRKELAVFGDRFWQPGPLGTVATEPLAFESMPVTYQRAFGGTGYQWNPEGLGVGAGQRGQTLPNIEFVDRRIESPASQPGPAGFGPIDASWRPRADRLGTYDAAWLANNWPGMPVDFVPGYWNEAPGDQQFTNGFRGDEMLAVLNMHPSQPRFEIALPGQRARAFYHKTDGTFGELAMMLDTIAVDMEAGQTELVWRGALPVRSARLRDVGFLFTMTEPVGVETAEAQCRALFEATCETAYPTAAERAEVAAREHVAKAEATAKAADKSKAELAAALAFGALVEAETKARTAAKMKPGMALPAAAPATTKHEAEILAAAGQDAVAIISKAGGTADGVWTRARVIAAHAAGEDMAKADLSGLDLSELDLTGAKLSRALLGKANLTGTWLQRAVLSNADAAGVMAERASFGGAKLDGARFSGASLGGAHFSEAGLAGADFSGLELAGLNFDRTYGAKAGFAGAKLAGASFRGANLPGADFSGAVLGGASFDDAVLSRADFSEVVAEGVSFLRADMVNLRAQNADMRRGRFAGVKGQNTVWLQARLDNADFSRALLNQANFSEAELSHAIFDRALLEASSFDEAVMRFAVVTNAKLVRASLERADLRDADFSGSNLYQAGLFRAHSSRLRLTGAYLAGTLMAP